VAFRDDAPWVMMGGAARPPGDAARAAGTPVCWRESSLAVEVASQLLEPGRPSWMCWSLQRSACVMEKPCGPWALAKMRRDEVLADLETAAPPTITATSPPRPGQRAARGRVVAQVTRTGSHPGTERTLEADALCCRMVLPSNQVDTTPGCRLDYHERLADGNAARRRPADQRPRVYVAESGDRRR